MIVQVRENHWRRGTRGSPGECAVSLAITDVANVIPRVFYGRDSAGSGLFLSVGAMSIHGDQVAECRLAAEYAQAVRLWDHNGSTPAHTLEFNIPIPEKYRRVPLIQFNPGPSRSKIRERMIEKSGYPVEIPSVVQGVPVDWKVSEYA